MSFDYVCVPLVCPACGRTAADPCDIDLQTKIALQPAQNNIRAGDRIELLNDPRDRDYLLLNADWRPGSRILRVLQTWSCPICGANPLWAKLTFQDGTLLPVDPAELDAAHLADADFITPEVLTLVPLKSVLAFQKLPPADLIRELVRVGRERSR